MSENDVFCGFVVESLVRETPLPLSDIRRASRQMNYLALVERFGQEFANNVYDGDMVGIREQAVLIRHATK